MARQLVYPRNSAQAHHHTLAFSSDNHGPSLLLEKQTCTVELVSDVCCVMFDPSLAQTKMRRENVDG